MTTPPQGVKRRGDDTLDSEQRLSKRFDLLNLDHNGKLWVPVSAVAGNASTRPATTTSAASYSEHTAASHDPYYPRRGNATATSPTPHGRQPTGDSMHLDDTAHTVYIHNLDEELASIPDDPSSSSGERLIFLPDIERNLGRVPRHLLLGNEAPPPVMGNEMILYNVPKSLSVPVESDGVRRAVIEARRRLRGEQEREQWGKWEERRDEQEVDDEMDEGAERRRQVEGGSVGFWQQRGIQEVEEDPDAMDLG